MTTQNICALRLTNTSHSLYIARENLGPCAWLSNGFLEFLSLAF